MGCELYGGNLSVQWSSSARAVIGWCAPFVKVTEENFEFDTPDGQPSYQHGIDADAVVAADAVVPLHRQEAIAKNFVEASLTPEQFGMARLFLQECARLKSDISISQ